MKKIKLIGKRGAGKFAKVDDEDFDYLNQNKWNFNGQHVVRSGYKETKTSRYILMHREIMRTSKNMFCDHIDHDTLNNQKNNLRNCTKTQNSQNRTSAKNSTSNYLGVTIWSRKIKGRVYNYWVAQIRVNKKLVSLGYFKFTNEGEMKAAKAYNTAAKKYHGKFSNLNKI